MVTEQDRKGLRTPGERVYWGYLAILFVFGTGIKAYLVLKNIPSIWLWGDEMYYFATAHDIAHWGQPGIPHPGFLYYPPVTSLITAPIHAFGLSNELVYQCSLVLNAGLLTTTIIAGALLYRELFGEISWGVPLILLFGPPAYAALLLMSEPSFITLYTWSIYFMAKSVKYRRLRDFIIVGILLSAMSMTRTVGLGSIVGVLACFALESFFSRRSGKDVPERWRYLATVAVFVGVVLLWKYAAKNFLPAAPGGFALKRYLVEGILPALGTLRGVGELAMRVLAQTAYISLTSFGVCLPLTVWYFANNEFDGREEEIQRTVIGAVLSFGLVAIAASVLHMQFMGARKPLPRYLLYGRYVEYFAIPLIVFAYGIWAGKGRNLGRARTAGLAAIGALSMGFFVYVIPTSFYEASIATRQIAPNSLGMAMLLDAVGTHGMGIGLIAVGVVWAIGLLLAATRGRRLRRLVEVGVVAAAIVVGASNFILAGREVYRESQGRYRYAREYSAFVEENEALFRNGLYLDFRFEGKYRGGQSPIFKLYTDHIEKIVGGKRPKEYLGVMPVVTKDIYDDQAVLFQAAKNPYRIYGVQKREQTGRVEDRMDRQ